MKYHKFHFAKEGIWPNGGRSSKDALDYFTGYIKRRDFGFIRMYCIEQRFSDNEPKGTPMEYATAYYVSEPYAEIYVFVDEPPSDLPESAVKIVDEKDPEAFLAALQPYFVMAADS